MGAEFGEVGMKGSAPFNRLEMIMKSSTMKTIVRILNASKYKIRNIII